MSENIHMDGVRQRLACADHRGLYYSHRYICSTSENLSQICMYVVIARTQSDREDRNDDACFRYGPIICNV